MDQILRYYEEIHLEKARTLKAQAITMSHATGYGFGSMKKDDFLKFLDSLDGMEEQQQDVVQKLRESGLPLEEQ